MVDKMGISHIVHHTIILHTTKSLTIPHSTMHHRVISTPQRLITTAHYRLVNTAHYRLVNTAHYRVILHSMQSYCIPQSNTAHHTD